MKRLRKVLFWCHLCVGLAVGAVVLVMSATGVLLTYERQMTRWADTRGLGGKPPTSEAVPLGTEALLGRLQVAIAEAPKAITWRADVAAPVAVAFEGQPTRYVHAYTGEVLGEGHAGVRAFFREVTAWHRWLGDDDRRLGKAVTGACNLGFLFLVMSGFYLWWPRHWTRKAVRNVAFFRRGLSPKARDFNWHNVIGVWTCVPLFVIVLSGVVISYPWASALVYEAVGETPPARRGAGSGRSEGGRTAEGGRAGAGVQERARAQQHSGSLLKGPRSDASPAQAADTLIDASGLDRLVARAAAQMPGWRTLTMQLPAAADTAVAFTLDRGTGGQPQHRAQLVLSRQTAAVVRWEPFDAGTPGRRLRSVLRFAHTGEVLGPLGQTLAGLASLGAVVLVWTGMALSWRRLRAWRHRPARPASGAARGPAARPGPARRPPSHRPADPV